MKRQFAPDWKPRPRRRKFDWDEAVRLYVEEGKTGQAIARHFGVSSLSVYRALNLSVPVLLWWRAGGLKEET